MDEPVPGTEAREPRWHTVALVVLCTTLVHAWTLRLEFQLDDYTILSNVGTIIGLDDRPVAEIFDRLNNYYLFRPVAWLLWAGVLKASGGEADPRSFHALMLGAHALTVWLLYRVLRPV